MRQVKLACLSDVGFGIAHEDIEQMLLTTKDSVYVCGVQRRGVNYLDMIAEHKKTIKTHLHVVMSCLSHHAYNSTCSAAATHRTTRGTYKSSSSRLPFVGDKIEFSPGPDSSV